MQSRTAQAVHEKVERARASCIWRAGAALLLALVLTWPSLAAEPVQVGSKRFTESYLLGAIVRETLQQAGVAAVHRPGLGNTAVLERSLASGAIDVYPEYTGTIVRELLQRDGRPTLDELNRWLAPRGLKAAVPLGFENTYALAMREADAARLGIVTVSDLARPSARQLRLGLSHEFIGRADGWSALRDAYALPFGTPSGLDHGLAYEALQRGQTDVIDVYATDAKITRAGVRVLRDDRAFFPAYDAVLLMRIGLDATPLQRLSGRIDARRMIALNAAVELDGQPYDVVARAFVAGLDAPGPAAPTAASAPGMAVATTDAVRPDAAPRERAGVWERLVADDLGRLTQQHLMLVLGSLLLALGVGVPLGVLAWRRPAWSQLVLGAVGLIQTVPSLAMLAFLIVLVGGIGFVPALLALFLYALLPIVSNVHAGLSAVRPGLAQAAIALGMTRGQCLRHVQLPLAMPTVLAGVQTAATINVGTATMAAFIGAGGYGERIVAGLALNDTAVLLSGALPAAALALLVQGGFEAWRRLQRRVAH